MFAADCRAGYGCCGSIESAEPGADRVSTGYWPIWKILSRREGVDDGAKKAWRSFAKRTDMRDITLRFIILEAKKSDTRLTIDARAGDLHITTNEAEQALIALDAPLYSRGGMIVRPVVEDPGKGGPLLPLVPWQD
jgi:hypothetical protein